MAASPDIVHRDVEARFEARLEGHRGELRYVRREVEGRSVMVIPSVVVDRAIEGRGVAGALTRAALEWARAEGLRVDPVCPYVDAWLRRHPEFAGLRA
ncbi:GNAT family N-acetyltransferase [Silanimonas sp.]|jgi:predicted GNAT family acetyltransferase|uniref:GNAT family N-acetyltransferase n=1 Tax=Silanimonas sp. TaxID=1929290 RepID=UPI0022CBAFA5|nr:GNAT family N-acetyltransferase [Silanimonas sp.]MCZ8113422.1 GNAT family N-acetyltransferase [Silanimonas sp.]